VLQLLSLLVFLLASIASIDVDGNNTPLPIPISHHMLGFSVSLSADGTLLAVGETSYGDNEGRVRTFAWDSEESDWCQTADFVGEAANDNSGHAVSLSDDGETVTIGSPFNDGNGDNSGHVRVYKYAE
jgi:hypothetical protein